MMNQKVMTARLSSVEDILISSLGESGAKALIFHMGGVSSLSDPEKLKRNLWSVLGQGAVVLLRQISVAGLGLA